MRYGIWGEFSLFSLLVRRELGASASVTRITNFKSDSQVGEDYVQQINMVNSLLSILMLSRFFSPGEKT